MSSLADVYVQVKPDVGGVARTMQSAGADSGRRFGAGFRDTVKTAIGNSLSTALDNVARGIGRGLKAVVVAGSDLNETINKSSTIFGKEFGKIDKFAQTAATSVGLSRQAALEATASFGDLFSQLGFSGKQAANMSVDVLKLSADLGSFNNLDTADVQDRIAAAFRGEYDSLQKVIPNINAARVEQVALEQTGKKTAKALTAQEKAAAVLAIVQKDGARAAGDFAKTQDGVANQVKIAKAQLMDMAGQIGTALQPALEAVMGFITKSVLPGLQKRLPGAIASVKNAFKQARDAIDLFKNAFKTGKTEDEGTWIESFAIAARNVKKALQPAMDTVKLFIGALTGKGADVEGDPVWQNKVIDAAAKVRAALDQIVPVLEGLGRFIMDTVLPAWLAWYQFIFQQFWPIIKRLGKFFVQNIVPALSVVIAFIRDHVVPGFLAIVGAVKGLLAVVIPIIAQIVSTIIDKFIEMKPQIMEIWGFIKQIITGVMFIIKTVIQNVTKTIGTFWARWGDTILAVVKVVFGLIVSIIRAVMKVVAGIIKLAVALIKGDWKGAWNAIKQIFGGVWDAIKAILKAAWGIVKALFAREINWVKNTWTSFWGKVKDTARSAMDWVKDKISTVLGKIKDAFQTAKDNIKKIWDGVKDVVSKPIVWIKDNVYNKPLVPVWNKVAELVSGPTLKAYAKGTKDAAKGWALVGEKGPEFINLTGGEEILPHGKKPSGDFSGLMRQDPIPRGGIGDWVKGIISNVASKVGDLKDWALGSLAGLAGKLLGGTKDLIGQAMPNSGVGRTVGDIGKKAIDLVLEKIKGDEEKAVAPAAGTGGPAGSAIAGGGWATIYRILRAVGARSFTTYAGHDQGASRSRDIWPPSQRIADTARRISSLWYVIYNRRIASMNYGRVWRPYYGSNPHTDHVHVTLKPGVSSGGFDDPTGLAAGALVKGGRGGVLAAIGEGRQDELVVPLPKGWQREGERRGGASKDRPIRIELNLAEDLRYVIETTLEDAEEGRASMRRLSR